MGTTHLPQTTNARFASTTTSDSPRKRARVGEGTKRSTAAATKLARGQRRQSNDELLSLRLLPALRAIDALEVDPTAAEGGGMRGDLESGVDGWTQGDDVLEGSGEVPSVNDDAAKGPVSPRALYIEPLSPLPTLPDLSTYEACPGEDLSDDDLQRIMDVIRAMEGPGLEDFSI